MSNQMDLDILKKLSTLPSSPFAIQARVDYVVDLLREHNIEIIEIAEAIIARPFPNPGKPKLVLMSHLDHPGIVLRNKHEGRIFGSVGMKRLSKLLANDSIPIRIFDRHGNLAGKGKIVSLAGRHNRKVKIETDVNVLANYSAAWDIDSYVEDSDKLRLYAADNDAVTASLLAAIINLKQNEALIKDFDVLTVFTLSEEVHQVSAFNLAKQNKLNLTLEDLLINLESKVLNPLESHSSPKMSYQGGLLLQLTDGPMVYGYQFPDAPNLSETIITKLANKLDIKMQVSPVAGSCDDRPFCYYPLTPNISTITIPNEFKHNIGKDGEIIMEQINKSEVSDLTKLLSKIICSSSPRPSAESENKTLLLKTPDNITDLAYMEEKTRLNSRLAHRLNHVVLRGHYYPQNLMELVRDILGSLLFYLEYLRQRL